MPSYWPSLGAKTNMLQTIKEALSHAVQRLFHDSARTEAEILLCYVLTTTRTYLYAHPEKELTPKQKDTYEQLIQQRAEGQPVSYLTGCREFWSLPLHVTSATLIPRPETEGILEVILDLFGHHPRLSILDLGTGSGAIALALAHERPTWQMTACDFSASALDIAQQNALHLKIQNIVFVQSHWFSALPPASFFDVIVSNPPYLAKNDPHLQEGDLRFEPLSALVAGPTGLEDLEHIIINSHQHLTPQGCLILEHGCTQQQAVANLFKREGFHAIQSFQDLQGHPRITIGFLT